MLISPTKLIQKGFIMSAQNTIKKGFITFNRCKPFARFLELFMIFMLPAPEALHTSITITTLFMMTDVSAFSPACTKWGL